MKRLLIILLFLLIGCAHGLIGELPVIANPDEAAEVYIIRGHNFFGSAASAYVLLDKEYILAIRIDEHTKFLAPPGEHMIGFKFRGNPAMRIPVEFKPQRKYYYGIKIGFGSVTLWPINEEEAIPWLQKTKYLSLDKEPIPNAPPLPLKD